MRESRSLRIDLFLIQGLADKGQLKELAVFLHLKSLYSNSRILNYTQQSLAEKSGLPLSSIKKHVKLFTDRGWCKPNFGTLMFEKLDLIDQQRKKKIYIKFEIASTVRQIYYDLCHQILKIKQSQFDRYQKLRADLSNPHPKIKRAANKMADKLGFKESAIGASSMLKISIKKIAEIIGVSVGSAAAIIKELKRQGRILCVSNFHSIVLGSGRYAKGLIDAGIGTFYHNGKVHFIECNSYKF